MPVVLGDGTRLLDNLDPARVQLEKIACRRWGRARRRKDLGRGVDPTIGSQHRLGQAIDLVELRDGRIEDEFVDSDVLELRCDVL